MANLKLSAPWEITYKKINAMFEEDPEVNVIIDRDVNTVNLYADNAVSDTIDIYVNTVKLYVNNANKAYALNELLKKSYDYGPVELKVIVVPTSKGNATATGWKGTVLYRAAFYRNPIFEYAVDGPAVFTNPITYVVFHPQVIQYFTDDLGDINGYHSTLAQDIAKDIFEDRDGVFYCTERTEIPLHRTTKVNYQPYNRCSDF